MQRTNLEVGRRAPEDYFAEAEARYPGVLASQWIPTEIAHKRLEQFGYRSSVAR